MTNEVHDSKRDSSVASVDFYIPAMPRPRTEPGRLERFVKSIHEDVRP